MTPREAIPKSWTDHLTDAPCGLGLDLATSDKGTSNPSSLAVTQREGRIYKERLIVSWKTADPDVTTAITKMVIEDIIELNLNIRRLAIDASNEVFFARQLKKALRHLCSCVLVKGGEKLKHEGEEMDAKTLIGHIYVNAIEDGQVELPIGSFIYDDHRLVKSDRGSFQTDTGKNGQHGDTFDAGKLSIWALIKGSGKVEAFAVGPGSKSKPLRKGLFGSLRDRFSRRTNQLNT